METLADLIFDTPRSELVKIIGAYNDYVVDFYETHDAGSTPVCLMEFYENDYVDEELSFIDDTEKMCDFISLTKDDFLREYSYITEEEYEATQKELLEDIAGTLANMMREAENIHLEEVNGRTDEDDLKSETIKTAVSNYLPKLTNEELEDFEAECDSMGI